MSADILLAEIGRFALGALVWAGSVAGATWAAVKFVPQQWLQHRFNRQLEQQRNEHAQQLEEARHRLSVLQKRLSTLHEKEFEVLSDAWEKLNEALGRVARLVSSFQSFPDLERMDEPEFEAFVAGSKFEPFDKAELLGKLQNDRNAFYQQRIVRYWIRDARTACAELHRSVQRNSIFLEPRIRDLFRKIDDLAWRTLISKEIGEEAHDRKLWLEAGERLNTEIMPLKDEIERQVQNRLGYE